MFFVYIFKRLWFFLLRKENNIPVGTLFLACVSCYSLSLYCLPSSNLLLVLKTSSLHYIYLNFQTTSIVFATSEYSLDFLLFIHYNITYLFYHDKSKRNPLCIEITAVDGSRSLKVRVAEYELRTTQTIEEGRKGNRVLSCLP